jgi:phosphatidate cytidylyltransferase
MNLLLRVVSGAALLGIVAAALWIGLPAVAVLVGLAALVTSWEFAGLAARAGFAPASWVLYPAAAWLAVRFALPGAFLASDWPLAAAVAAGLVAAVLLGVDFRRWASAVAGAVYLGFSLGFYIALFRWPHRGLDHFGLRLVAVPLLAVFAGDTVAYFAGTAIGRHRFFAAISPRKTLEGALAGAAATVLVAAVAGPAIAGLSAAAGIGLGALVALAAQGGDLVESALKRQAGAKDSSALIPGHGGILDRVDSLVLVGPVVYCYLRLIAFA